MQFLPRLKHVGLLAHFFMKDAEKYLKYKQDKFIEKAAIWLNTCFISHDEYGIISNQFDTEEEMIEDFKEYMKG